MSRRYTDKTLKILYSLAGNQCSFPNCNEVLVNIKDKANYSMICHIEAASEGGPRYNPKLTQEERSSYNNLILLCPTHHTHIDKSPEKYTVEKLKNMKSLHELRVSNKTSDKNDLVERPSTLVKIINILSNINLDEIEGSDLRKSFNVDKKIRHNDIKDYRAIIEKYKIYQGMINDIYSEIEKDGSLEKNYLLANINSTYLIAKGKYLENPNDIVEIRQKSDFLIKEVLDMLWNEISNNVNLEDDVPIETINNCMRVIVVDAFMRCKILEAVNDN